MPHTWTLLQVVGVLYHLLLAYKDLPIFRPLGRIDALDLEMLSSWGCSTELPLHPRRLFEGHSYELMDCTSMSSRIERVFSAETRARECGVVVRSWAGRPETA